MHLIWSPVWLLIFQGEQHPGFYKDSPSRWGRGCPYPDCWSRWGEHSGDLEAKSYTEDIQFRLCGRSYSKSGEILPFSGTDIYYIPNPKYCLIDLVKYFFCITHIPTRCIMQVHLVISSECRKGWASIQSSLISFGKAKEMLDNTIVITRLFLAMTSHMTSLCKQICCGKTCRHLSFSTVLLLILMIF